MNKNRFSREIIILVLSLIGMVAFFLVGALIFGLIGGVLTALLLRPAMEGGRGDQALGAMAFVWVGMGIFGLLGGVLSSLLGQIFVSRRLAKRYGSTLGSHPVLKITLLTWGIIIAAVFLFKTLAF